MHQPLRSILALTLLAATGLAQADDWQLAKQEDGIQVYTRAVAGSKYKAYRGVVQIKADPATIARLQDDPAGSCKWIFRCQSLQVLKRQDNQAWTYMRIDMPWPVTARDVVLHVTEQKTPDGGFTRTLEGVPDYRPPADGYVRVASFQGQWRVVPKNGGAEVTYEAQSEPGGSVPSWLANSFVVDAPLNTLKGLRQAAQR